MNHHVMLWIKHLIAEDAASVVNNPLMTKRLLEVHATLKCWNPNYFAYWNQ